MAFYFHIYSEVLELFHNHRNMVEQLRGAIPKLLLANGTRDHHTCPTVLGEGGIKPVINEMYSPPQNRAYGEST